MLALLVLLLGVGAWARLLARPDSVSASLEALLLQRKAELRTARASVSEVPAQPASHETYALALGDSAQVEHYVNVLFEMAERSEIQLDTGEYKWQAERGIGVDRYSVRLPIKGSYVHIREFCERALIALPFASIDQLSLKRETAADENVGATLQLTLFLRSPDVRPASGLEGNRS
ncbi:hypothetical protein LNV08_09110 [Paucibacter sp. TC2R-5]|uniref:hypothetical protein n=1 Tax=Paucibacter sp. TC2R-5 TaxID=2893555 RepID=UPI0021E477DF|nr:hypothetical protein [Paucibacter sp. TC2R-5]MCV2359134.1 hypothetical protein [Paucibacter sp. TC2R-5]